MNMTLSIIRSAVLLVLSTAALILICGEDTPEASLSAFFIAKGLGLAAGYATIRLYKRWSVSDALIAKYDKWCEKGMDAPNPMRID